MLLYSFIVGKIANNCSEGSACYGPLSDVTSNGVGSICCHAQGVKAGTALVHVMLFLSMITPNYAI